MAAKASKKQGAKLKKKLWRLVMRQRSAMSVWDSYFTRRAEADEKKRRGKKR